MRRTYISAPYWHPNPTVREWNTRRAELLARLAAAEGFEPVAVHRSLMDAGVDDDADPAARARGLERTCATVREITREGGAMYLLWTDNVERTAGVAMESRTWGQTAGPPPSASVWATWQGYRPRMERAGLLAEWKALAVQP